MRYKTLFRILCKGLGVYFVASGLVSFVGVVAGTTIGVMRFAGIAGMASSGFGFNEWWALLGMAGPAVEVGIGLYLFFGGRRVADWAIPGNRPYCPECGYDLTAAVSDVCPECGTHPLKGRKEEAKSAGEEPAQRL